MTVTMKKFAAALLAAVPLATIVPASSAVAGPGERLVPVTGAPVGVGNGARLSQPGLVEHAIKGPRVRARSIVIGIDGGYHTSCYWKLVRFHLVKICPDFDLY